MIVIINLFKNIYRLAEKLNNFTCHHFKIDFCHKNMVYKVLQRSYGLTHFYAVFLSIQLLNKLS